MNAGKSKLMVFERREAKLVDFSTPYRVSVPAVGRCEVATYRRRKNEEVNFKYLGTVLCKHEVIEGEIRERIVKSRCVIGSFTSVFSFSILIESYCYDL